MKTKVLTVLVLALAIQAQQSNTQRPEQQHAETMKRGDAGMGFSHEQTVIEFHVRALLPGLRFCSSP